MSLDAGQLLRRTESCELFRKRSGIRILRFSQNIIHPARLTFVLMQRVSAK